MENVTDEQAKTLKLFAYYAQGYGKKEVNTGIYTQDCQEDWRDDEWYGDGSNLESYEAIDNCINQIIEEHDLFEKLMSDCDNRGQLNINIDCVERTLKIDAYETKFDTNPSNDMLELSDIESEDLIKIFNYMKSKKYFTMSIPKEVCLGRELFLVLIENVLLPILFFLYYSYSCPKNL